MTLDNVSQFLVSIAMVLFIVDLAAQIRKMYVAKTSREVSLIGLSIRFIGSTFFVLRFGVIGEDVLFIGQIIFSIMMATYGYLVIKYRKN